MPGKECKKGMKSLTFGGASNFAVQSATTVTTRSQPTTQENQIRQEKLIPDTIHQYVINSEITLVGSNDSLHRKKHTASDTSGRTGDGTGDATGATQGATGGTVARKGTTGDALADDGATQGAAWSIVVRKNTSREIKLLQTFDFSNTYDNVKFCEVDTTDDYRMSRPYKVFRLPGVSKVAITFDVDMDTDFDLGGIIVGLNHCSTNCHGVIDMYVNSKPFRLAYDEVDKLHFREEMFLVEPEFCVPGTNVFTIVLGKSSPGVYWLSDARIAIEKINWR